MSKAAVKQKAKPSKAERELEALQNRAQFVFKDMDCVKAFDKILKMKPNEVLDMVLESGLRGRGGAGFPTGQKLKAAADTAADMKYIFCNADEGEPGTFKDRVIFEKQMDKVFLGMAVCAFVTKAPEGIIYLRGEYNFMKGKVGAGCKKWNALFKSKKFPFKVILRSGSGAYECGEETALIESLEGKRGEPRLRPPFPAFSGFLGKPTVVDNVETLACIATIVSGGLKNFKSIGLNDTAGSKVFSVSGDARIKGVFELPLGMTVREFVDIFGDRDTKAIQVGGYSGFCIPRKDFRKMIIGKPGAQTGGSMILLNSSRSMVDLLKNILEFFQEEFCGQCPPCRVGCQQLLLGIEAVHDGAKPLSHIDKLRELTKVMVSSSFCGLGVSVANPFNSIMDNFFDEFRPKRRRQAA